MFPTKTFSILLVAFALLADISTTNADVVFNLTPGAGGSTVMEIIGTGHVGNDGFNGYSAEEDYLLVDPDVAMGSQDADVPSLGLSLDGQTADFMSIMSIEGTPDFTLFDITFTGDIGIGAELSELDGVYTVTDFNFNGFLPGQYELTRDSGIDVGSITVNVSAIPEPSGMTVLSLAFLAHGVRRRKRK